MTANQAGEGAKEIQTKYDEFQNACKTVLPKVDRKLSRNFFFDNRRRILMQNLDIPLKSIQGKD